MDPVRQKIERLVFIFLFALAAAVASFLYYIHQDYTLARLESHYESEFALFKYYPDSLPLPALRMKVIDTGAEDNVRNYQGDYLLLNLWATWCTPCLAELPDFQRLKARYLNKGLNVVAVSIEQNRPPKELLAFLIRNDIGSVAYYQDAWGDYQKTLIFSALPTTYLIAPNGRILYQMTGTTDWYAPEMIKFLDAAMKVY